MQGDQWDIGTLENQMREAGGMQSVLGCSPLIAFADSAWSSELLMLLVQQAVSRK